MKREMVSVKIFLNSGKIEIENIPSDYATQKINCYSTVYGNGIGYHCKKGKEAYYLKKLLREEQSHIDTEIAKLEQNRAMFKSLEDKLKTGGI